MSSKILPIAASLLDLMMPPQRDATLLGTPTVRAIPCGVSLIGCFSTTSGSRPACFVMRISTHRDVFPTTHRVLFLSLISLPQPKPFRFFNMWADHQDFMATVENGWNLNVDGTTQFCLCRKLKAFKGHLKAFNNLHFSHISVRAKDADLALQDAQIQLESDPENTTIRDSVGSLGRRPFPCRSREALLLPKGQAPLLKNGGSNTKFFHDMVKRNAAKSSILAITKTDGTTITSAMEIGQEFVSYFTSLLGTEVPTLPVDNAVFNWGPKLSPSLFGALQSCHSGGGKASNFSYQ
ncbi:UNVERIFIED_CONTAM: hypothetical protein Sradi_4506700 [Sesamum radiatum]|uniref:Uncharacterized protein n=1 Tax=Sesamum radiatum TaxID=300843 RepID=A0AAW2N827_SESRA